MGAITALTTKAITPTDTPPLSPRLHTPRVRSVLRLRLPRPARLTPGAGAASATSRTMGERPRVRRRRETDSASALPPPLPIREARRVVHACPRSTTRRASRLLWAADHVPGRAACIPRARTYGRDGPSARGARHSRARAFLRPRRVLRRSARARTPTRTHPPSPSLKPCAVGLSALRRPAAQGGAGRGQLSFTDLGTPLHPPRPELEALPSWM